MSAKLRALAIGESTDLPREPDGRVLVDLLTTSQDDTSLAQLKAAGAEIRTVTPPGMALNDPSRPGGKLQRITAAIAPDHLVAVERLAIVTNLTETPTPTTNGAGMDTGSG
ncbi:MAG: hypothetical protein M3137_06085 [Actinomycetota bacterium]|nr:hypothetical protein [Actinomycetota bacterium]